jgi:hypothetical protein
MSINTTLWASGFLHIAQVKALEALGDSSDRAADQCYCRFTEGEPEVTQLVLDELLEPALRDVGAIP